MSYISRLSNTMLPSSLNYFGNKSGTLAKSGWEVQIQWKSHQTIFYKDIPVTFIAVGTQETVNVFAFNADFGIKRVAMLKVSAVQCLKILPDTCFQQFQNQGPLAAVSTSVESSSFSRSCVMVYSLQSQQSLHVLRFRSPVANIIVSPHFLVICLESEFHFFSYESLTFCFSVDSLSVSTIPPVAIGSCLMAFISAQTGDHVAFVQDPLPMATQVASTVSNIVSNVALYTEHATSKVSSYFSEPVPHNSSLPIKPKLVQSGTDGVVTVLDLSVGKIMGRFQAHKNGIRNLLWSPDGSLLLTIPYHGQHGYIWKIEFDLKGGMITRKILRLHRGILPASIIDASFSDDSSLLQITSDHGTSHIYVIASHKLEVPFYSFHTHTSIEPRVADVASYVVNASYKLSCDSCSFYDVAGVPYLLAYTSTSFERYSFELNPRKTAQTDYKTYFSKIPSFYSNFLIPSFASISIPWKSAKVTSEIPHNFENAPIEQAWNRQEHNPPSGNVPIAFIDASKNQSSEAVPELLNKVENIAWSTLWDLECTSPFNSLISKLIESQSKTKTSDEISYMTCVLDDVPLWANPQIKFKVFAPQDSAPIEEEKEMVSNAILPASYLSDLFVENKNHAIYIFPTNFFDTEVSRDIVAASVEELSVKYNDESKNSVPIENLDARLSFVVNEKYLDVNDQTN